MAQRVVTELTDDLDGTTIGDGEGETIRFSLESVEYEIDLSHKNADKLRKALQPFTDAGRKVGGGTRRARSTSKSNGSGDDPKAIRAWAVEHGIDMPARGRIPASIVEQYKTATA